MKSFIKKTIVREGGKSRPMTAKEEEKFDKAMAEMDEAFARMDTAFEEMRRMMQ